MEPRNFIVKANEYMSSIRSPGRYSEENMRNIRDFLSRITRNTTIKFLMPEGGVLLNDSLDNVPSRINLPFSEISLEFSSGEACYIVYAIDREDHITIQSFNRSLGDLSGNLVWWPNPYQTRLAKTFNLTDQGFLSPRRIMFQEIFNLIPENHKQIVIDSHENAVRSVLELIEALSCSNVFLETISPSLKLNKARASRGRIPFFEYKVLTINVPTEHSANRVPLGGTHSSPRQHLRRGHIRVYNRHTPEEYRIWINNMIINRSDPHIIEKDYILNA